ncbi:hypothetical protein M378DRAFT_74530 [Amanita muscaria Koide BX008]|uniref:Fe2OG dioxygenase domain-containing protein n=1 Tax=Amanita muscaria (strain Koide BX008) TaxID=946122 RepID=A0A0C2TIC8_AMAMK|nr:hypothetical protein M378DRAFT_74530 [Amanita muscaria Koide BX008]
MQRVDFSAQSAGLAKHYRDFYAIVIDDAFSAEECRALVDQATAASGPWSPAGLSAHATVQTVHSEFRNSERIIHIDEDSANKIYDRLYPLLGDIHEITPSSQWSRITGREGQKQRPTWKLVGVNPRLSFLRYGPGHYFKPHCDGLTNSPDGQQKSFVTIHLYLNGDGLVGGATRFWTPDKKEYLDVEPKLGRVLVFQQRMLIHSGEEVTAGVKYTVRSDLMFVQTTPH